ncbi:c-type cytochrome biogenesis protein CcmI [Amorphus orientalis]|uniref:Cytochrome c-type biogenesis protein CcmH n=1 Tax=Amorphus orientalis TaxID=649198 RepID=A0AAE4ARF5_9HYPH|nr:c-type cytochrome biogenesis protein CcmI [Amorphus orientalis]MDQ0315131.1 cytochrome c-type biogenesis protein CcmH [Amorphus orientalis]
MLFWSLAVLLTAVAILAVLVPLARRGGDEAGASDPDVAVYKAQLDELDRDAERGLISAQEVEAARAEIARRLLRARERQKGAGSSTVTRRRVVAVVALVALPLVAVVVYGLLGNPGYPDQPRAERMAEAEASGDLQALVARVEDHLGDNPDDGRGWAVLAPIYLRAGRANDAVAAFQSAIRLDGGDQATLYAGLGEALVQASGGVVTEEATTAFEQALELNPQAVRPRFFLALGLGQAGRTDAAISAWQALIASADGNEPWVPIAQQQLAALGGETAAPGLPGPSAEQVEAAGEMNASDRRAMIEGMVSGLAARLESEGGSVDEWIRLMRAYQVLGQPDDARSAADSARAAFSGDPEAEARIDETERDLGLNQ